MRDFPPTPDDRDNRWKTGFIILLVLLVFILASAPIARFFVTLGF